jgi:hypothetical protein
MLAAVYPRMQARRLRYNKGHLAVLRDRATEEESPALLLHKTVRGFMVSPERAPRSGIALVFAAEDSMIPVLDAAAVVLCLQRGGFEHDIEWYWLFFDGY